jgi:hypothetical protein
MISVWCTHWLTSIFFQGVPVNRDSTALFAFVTSRPFPAIPV